MKIIIQLPNAGLGNKLLVWSRAVVYANKYSISFDKLIASPWIGFHPKRVLRRDKDQRLYINEFRSSDLKNLMISLFTKCKIIDPPLETIPINNICFKTLPINMDYFYYIRGNEEIIRKNLFKIVHPTVMFQYSNFESYDLAIHVRRGDFKGELMTPIEQFVKIQNALIEFLGFYPKTYIFTDGNEEDIIKLLNFPNVSIIKDNPAILDLLLISKAKIIIPSIRSTFSYFAAFISDAHILKHYEDYCGIIRTDRVDLFEGKVSIINSRVIIPEEFQIKFNNSFIIS